jgi:hypothetical protein
MTIYEVNLTVDAGIAHDYAAWLDGHIRQILEIDGFLSAEWFEIEGESDRRQWTVQYRLRDRRSLEEYFTEHAEQMRADGTGRFGSSFSATRRILELRMEFMKQ